MGGGTAVQKILPERTEAELCREEEEPEDN